MCEWCVKMTISKHTTNCERYTLASTPLAMANTIWTYCSLNYLCCRQLPNEIPCLNTASIYSNAWMRWLPSSQQSWRNQVFNSYIFAKYAPNITEHKSGRIWRPLRYVRNADRIIFPQVLLTSQVSAFIFIREIYKLNLSVLTCCWLLDSDLPKVR